ncbi:peptidase inhibitor family I36 protein [Saccharothrix texasensis]|uniref:Peptidase inhibitor family I36 n=1 Tax=Saccharothrix texasensis TaxID=103734 RepID=A0A3N1HIT3_9PSEU|nr:peptidase inhibitor family I36 protein [Saccharothrix texasensis]ROP42447.1 peptidase inhibitor family I36 [Saccharothrix texasensis]
MRVTRRLVGLAAVITTVIGSFAIAPTASAATIEGCREAYLCFYFNSNFEGARADYLLSDGDLDNEKFNNAGTDGNGFNYVVKNHAASVVNNWSYYATVYYNSGCNGSVASQSFGAYGKGNFTEPMKNDNASFKWPTSSGTFRDCANRDQF